jgi:LacI family transcriptional regulator
MSVIGFDDMPIAVQLHPQLSTIRQPLPAMARAAVNLLLALIAGIDAPSQQILLPTQLIVRETTKALKPARSAGAARPTAPPPGG